MRHRIPVLALGVLLIVSGCSRFEGGVDSTAPDTTLAIAEGVECGGPLTGRPGARLAGVDGMSIVDLVASPSRSDTVWVVGEESGAPLAVALLPDGTRAATVPLGRWLQSATDIATGPGPNPDSDYLYIADLDDAEFDGRSLEVLRIDEQAELSPDQGTRAPEVLALTFFQRTSRPGAMVVDPSGGDVILLVPGTNGADLYRAATPEAGQEPTLLTIEARLNGAISGGLEDVAASPAGDVFAIVSDFGVLLWPRPPNSPVAAALVEPPCQTRFPTTAPAVAIGFSSDGGGLHSVGQSSVGLVDLEIPTTLRSSFGDLTPPAGNLAPEVSIALPSASDIWQMGNSIAVAAVVTDDDPVTESDLVWELISHRCPSDEECVAELLSRVEGSTAVLPSPDRIGFPAPTRLELRASYTDRRRLTGAASLDLAPPAASLTVDSTVAGSVVTVDGVGVATPLTAPLIVGDSITLEMEPLQDIDGLFYEFDGWSDGGEREHLVSISGEDQVVTANLRPERGHLLFSGLPENYVERRVSISSATSVLDVRAWVALADWTPDQDQAILGSNGNHLELAVTRDGYLRGRLRMASEQSILAVSTSPLNLKSGDRRWVRYVLDVDTGEARFFVSDDRTADGLLVNWAQLGEPVMTDAAGPLFPRIRSLIIGQSNPQDGRPMAGKVFGATWLADGRQIRRIDFSTTAQLTSSRPSYSQWGSYLVQGPDWRYIESAQP